MLEIRNETSPLPYSGKRFDVRRIQVGLPNGEGPDIEREIVSMRTNAVAILPIFRGQNFEPFFVLVRNYRFPITSWLLEVPAGKVEKEESSIETAKRELMEEAGYVAKKWTSYGMIYPSPGVTNEKINLYLARDLTKVPQKLEPSEAGMQVYMMPVEDAETAIIVGKIVDAKTLVMILRFLRENTM